MIATISIWLNHEDQFEEIKKLGNLTSIVILGEVEFHYNALQQNKQIVIDICDFADNKGIPVYFITGLSNIDSNLLLPDDPLLNRFHIIYWPTFWLSYTFKFLNIETNRLHNLNVDIDIEKLSPYRDYSYTFLSLNNQPHVHRCALMDMFEKYNLFETNKVSFRKHTEFNFKYWKQKILMVDQEDISSVLFNREQLPACYNYCFMQVVTESDFCDKYTLSGSTALPLLLGKPFLTLGRVKYMEFLERFGFKRYDEIFNYQYDNLEDVYDRTEALTIELNRIQSLKKDWKTMFKKIYPKLVYNRQRAITLATDVKNFPRIWLNIAKQDYIPKYYSSVYPKTLLQDLTELYDKFKTKI